MADITITAANVVAGAGAHSIGKIAGEAITAGQAVYIDSATKKVMRADSNAATAIARQPTGIALNDAALNQPIQVLTSGPITIGATLTAGVAYYLSDTPGGICPVADVGSGEYPCIIGMATSTSVIDVDIQYSGVAL